METLLTVRFAALCGSVAITMALLQSVALLGHPRLAGGVQVAHNCSPAR